MSGTSTRSKSGGAKRAAARSEKKKAQEPRTATWKGVKFAVPDELPATLTIDLGRIDAMDRRGGEGTLGALYELVESLIGDAGLEKVRQALRNGAGKGYETIDGRLYTDILDAVLKAYGTSMGESSASKTS